MGPVLGVVVVVAIVTPLIHNNRTTTVVTKTPVASGTVSNLKIEHQVIPSVYNIGEYYISIVCVLLFVFSLRTGWNIMVMVDS